MFTTKLANYNTLSEYIYIYIYIYNYKVIHNGCIPHSAIRSKPD